jgi:hypothetical protein
MHLINRVKDMGILGGSPQKSFQLGFYDYQAGRDLSQGRTWYRRQWRCGWLAAYRLAVPHKRRGYSDV